MIYYHRDVAAAAFDFWIRLGVFIIVETFCLSALAVTGCLVYIAYSAIKSKWSTSTHVHWYFLNLLVSDLIQAIGGIMSIKWVVEAGVGGGAFCTAQGIIKQMGDVGVAFTSLTIALHTFCVLVFRWKPPPKTALVILSGVWIFIALIIGVSMATHKGKIYYGNTQYWCWITEEYSVQRIVLEYLWMWLTAFINIIVYVFLALVIKGFIVVQNGSMRIPPMSERVHTRLDHSSGGRQSGAVALQMLYYPAVYTVTVFPVAVVRWLAFKGHTVPFPATVFTGSLFAASGVFNVLLFKYTRPKLLNQRPSFSLSDFPTKLSGTRDRRSHLDPDNIDFESFNTDITTAAPRQSNLPDTVEAMPV